MKEHRAGLSFQTKTSEERQHVFLVKAAGALHDVACRNNEHSEAR
jgi:hypothetical protein